MKVVQACCPKCNSALKTSDPPAATVRCPECQYTWHPTVSDSTDDDGHGLVESGATRDLPAENADLAEMHVEPEASTSRATLPLATNQSSPTSTSSGETETERTRSDGLLPERLGRFEIRRWLGAGAFGDVYQAYDPQLDREVALKIAKAEKLGSESCIKRFLREAKSAANLRHPHIVAVFDSGVDQGRYYIASAFIPGHSLAKETAFQGRLPPERAADIVRRLAEALGYAHSKGVVHRDVKPANVMLDEHGEPMLLDFGLAARPEEAERLTQEGLQALGTPAYMAPEQAKGKGQAASDQYSLGCTLYELLTGETPFQGPPDIQLFLHQTQEPKSPRSLQRGLSRDLETICLKCLEKEPQRRYADCETLAEDLRRCRAGEPIIARRVGPVERAVKWSRKNPLTATLMASVAAVLLLGAGVAWGLAAWALGEAKRADEKAVAEGAAKADTQKELAAKEKQLYRAESFVYVSQCNEAYNALLRDDFLGCRLILDECRWDLRGPEYGFLVKQLDYRARSPYGPRKYCSSMVLSEDGRRLVAADRWDGTIKAWDLDSSVERFASPGDVDARLVLSRDGKRLVCGGRRSGQITVWDIDAGKQILILETGCVHPHIVLSDNGRRLVCACDKEIKVWDVDLGKPTLTLKHGLNFLCRMALSSYGRRLVCAGMNTTKVWNLFSGEHEFTLEEENQVQDIALTPDGGSLFVAYFGFQTPRHGIKAYDLEKRRESFAFHWHSGTVRSLLISDDGKHLYSGHEEVDGKARIKVWSVETGEEAMDLQGHKSDVTHLRLAGDGRQLVSAGADGTIKIWDLAARKEITTIRAHDSRLHSLGVSRDGRRIASSSGTVIHLYHIDAEPQPITFKGHSGPVTCLALSKDGTHLISGSEDGTIRLWDPQSCKSTSVLRGHTGGVTCLVVSPDGKTLFSGSHDKTIRMWELSSGEGSCLLESPYAINSVAVGGRILFAGTDKQYVFPFDLSVGKKMTHVSAYGAQVVVSDNGQRFCCADSKGYLRVSDFDPNVSRFPSHWRQPFQGTIFLRQTTPAPGASSLAFSRSGELLVSGRSDATIEVWNLPDATSDAWHRKEVEFNFPGHKSSVLRGHSAVVNGLALSGNHRRLISCSGDSTIKFWDLETGKVTATLKGHEGSVNAIVLSSDGRTLFSGGEDHTIKMWDLDPGLEIGTLRGHTGEVNRVALSGDGKRLLSGGERRDQVLGLGHRQGIVLHSG